METVAGPMRAPFHSLLVLAALAGCDIATVPATTHDGLGRPGVLARAQLEVLGLPPGLDAMVVDVGSLAIRRTRDQVWLPLSIGSTEVVMTPDAPLGELSLIPLGADTYDRIELVVEGVHVVRQGELHPADLDRDDATLAVQWRLDRDVAMVLAFDYRDDMDLTADSLHMVFAPLAELR